MTGIGLVLGSLISLPMVKFNIKKLTVSPKQLALGVYGLLGYHAALFIALQTAPKVQANLVNYLWPLLIILLSPLYIRGMRISLRTLLGAGSGFAGAAIAISSAGEIQGGFASGYFFAFVAAVVWATYSLGTRSFGETSTATVGVFAFVAGLSAIALHLIFEPSFTISGNQIWILLALGLGPLGSAFYFWDYAIKKGNPQQIGLLSFLTPLLSTMLLLIVTAEPLTWLLALSAALIVGGALLGQVKK
jgi:drug/metabolite transporter (DMT)-like permease